MTRHTRSISTHVRVYQILTTRLLPQRRFACLLNGCAHDWQPPAIREDITSAIVLCLLSIMSAVKHPGSKHEQIWRFSWYCVILSLDIHQLHALVTLTKKSVNMWMEPHKITCLPLRSYMWKNSKPWKARTSLELRPLVSSSHHKPSLETRTNSSSDSIVTSRISAVYYGQRTLSAMIALRTSWLLRRKLQVTCAVVAQADVYTLSKKDVIRRQWCRTKNRGWYNCGICRIVNRGLLWY